MAGLGALVEARFLPPDQPSEDTAKIAAELPEDYFAFAFYDGPPAPLVVAEHDECRSTWIGGAPEGPLVLPWGTLDSIDDPGAYRRLADGIRSEGDGIDMTVRLVGTSVRASKRWLEIDVDGGPHLELRKGVVRGLRLLRDEGVVAKGFRGKAIEVAADATPIDSVVVAAVWASLELMLRLPKMPELATLGP